MTDDGAPPNEADVPKLIHRERVPTKTLELIVSFIRTGNTIETSAQCAGIHKSTFYDWVKRGRKGEEGYVEAVAAIDMALAQAEAMKVNQIHTAAAGGAYQAAMWWLERRNPRHWGRRDHLSVHQTKAAKVDVSRMSDAELLELISRDERGEDPESPTGPADESDEPLL